VDGKRDQNSLRKLVCLAHEGEYISKLVLRQSLQNLQGDEKVETCILVKVSQTTKEINPSSFAFY
jgi:hypothetical protein